jgi:hypothetical protein
MEYKEASEIAASLATEGDRAGGFPPQTFPRKRGAAFRKH